MSRRRVSVRDLGAADCQGWLHRRKEARSFLSSRWKKYWFVLKKSSLYWYTSKMAEKAEGFINLSGFTIEPARQSRRKHAITASHPLVVTIFVAAENFTDMNKWFGKLSAAAEPTELINSEDRYSEGSDHDENECASTSCCLDSQLNEADSENGDDLHPCESSSVPSLPSATLTFEPRRRSSSADDLNRTRRRATSGSGERLSWLDVPGAAVSRPRGHDADQTEKRVGHGEHPQLPEKPPDEMEVLYKHLKAASLSPIGPSGRRDFRASFIRRCVNDQVNEKLHLLRILSSTMKAKQAELLAVEQILHMPTLSPPTYRKWRLSNTVLLQDIAQRHQAAGGAAELQPDSSS